MVYDQNVFTKYVPEYTDAAHLKPGQLTPELIEGFFKDGYLLVPKFFDLQHDLEPCKVAVGKMVDQIAERLYKAGKIKNLYKDVDLFHRMPLINKEFPGATVLLHKIGAMPEEFMKVWTNEKLLNLVEQLIGPDIGGHPVWNLRPKAPMEQNHDVPWHQDNGYLDPSVDNVLQITAWIPLTDADENNGCLQVLKGGHKTGKVAPHLGCWADTWYIYLDPEKITPTLNVSPDTDCVTLPVPYGGLLLFSNALPHRSLPNQSDMVRWSLDLRWQNPKKSFGFHGVKDGVTFRTKNQRTMKPEDWEAFNSLDRQKVSVTETGAKINWHNDGETTDDELDTTITPFYMYRWPLVHENRHTARLSRKS